mmetsp:Transcript_67855/g.122233  ORF Transcript_67855/g.122233 Transcript_67855/m.122233 type:complete len:374 (-) Transcript_67855:221-1342(-)
MAGSEELAATRAPDASLWPMSSVQDQVQESGWADEAYRILMEYRRSYDYEAHRSEQKSSSIKRPFETLETAFQVTCQVMVALLAPRVHPFMRQLSSLLRLKRTYPEVLPSPSLSVLVSGLHAKLVLDVANLLSLPPFRWVEHRPSAAETLHPLSVHGLELNLLGAMAGVSLGRLAVAARQGLQWLAIALANQMPSRAYSWIGPQVARAAPLAAAALHLTVCLELAPPVVAGLASLLREAQLRRRPLIPTVASAFLRRSRRLFRQLAHWGQDDEEDEAWGQLHWWEGPDVDDGVPHDLLCPITGQLFAKPVVLHGTVFEESAIKRWVAFSCRHPILRDISCCLEDVKPARDVEALCHRIAAAKGLVGDTAWTAE